MATSMIANVGLAIVLAATAAGLTAGCRGSSARPAPSTIAAFPPPAPGAEHVVSLAYYPYPEGSSWVAAAQLGGVNGTGRPIEPVLAALPHPLPGNPAQPSTCPGGRPEATIVLGFDDGTSFHYGPCTWPVSLGPAIELLTHIKG